MKPISDEDLAKLDRDMTFNSPDCSTVVICQDDYFALRERLRLAESIAQGALDAQHYWHLEHDKLEQRLKRIQDLVDKQAEDGALWDEPVGGFPISEAYVLQELRRLHALIEGTESP